MRVLTAAAKIEAQLRAKEAQPAAAQPSAAAAESARAKAGGGGLLGLAYASSSSDEDAASSSPRVPAAAAPKRPALAGPLPCPGELLGGLPEAPAEASPPAAAAGLEVDSSGTEASG